MRFFSKIVFVCNCCFLAAVILRWVEILSKKKGHSDGALILQPVESTIVVLGYGAVVINLLFNLIILILLLVKKDLQSPKWLICLNFLFLIAQFYYFFF